MASNISFQLQSIGYSFLDHKFVKFSRDGIRRSLTLSSCRFRNRRPPPKQVFASLKSYSLTSSLQRRSDCQLSLWSLESVADGREMEVEKEIMNNLKEEVRHMLEDERLVPLALLERIDNIHRLGLGYLFDEKIKTALKRIYHSSTEDVKRNIGKSMYATALYFKLLRQHGLKITTDIFENFMDNGNFSTTLGVDARDLLSLYEASHLAFDGETTLDKAREFASYGLRNTLDNLDMNTAERVSHALEIPFHHRVQRLDARWNIETYDGETEGNQYSDVLHKLTRLDVNLVQSIHQQDLAELSRWWREIDSTKKLSFARDRLMESFFRSVGMVYQPQYSRSRKWMAKAFQLISVLKDMYNVFGRLEDLQQFTNAMEGWDISAIKDLPDCMKKCFLAVYNTVYDLAFDLLREQGVYTVPHLSKIWADLCKAFLEEATWNYEKHMPSFDEYLINGCVLCSGAVLLVHAYLSMSHEDVNLDVAENLMDYPDIIRLPCTISCLANDFILSEVEIQRGQTVNAITCYMQETGKSEEVTRAYIKKMIAENWKKMNREMFYNSIFPKSLIETACNFARSTQCQYYYGDGLSNPDLSRNEVVVCDR